MSWNVAAARGEAGRAAGTGCWRPTGGYLANPIRAEQPGRLGLLQCGAAPHSAAALLYLFQYH